jgi:dTDP-4-amino-4,6-dideoxygalactose transaminase
MWSIDYYVDALRRRVPFTYAKINHAFWERLTRIHELITQGVADPHELDIRGAGVPHLMEGGYVRELLALFRRLPALRGDFHMGVSTDAFPNSERLAVFPNEDQYKVLQVLQCCIPEGMAGADPWIWKRAIEEGKFAELVAALRERDVVLIGPPELSAFGAFARLPQFDHEIIDRTNARTQRTDLMWRIRRRHSSERRPVYLVQAGSLSAWLALRLHGHLSHFTFIDMGTALDICNFALFDAKWIRLRRKHIAGTISAVNPDWPENPLSFHGVGPTDRIERMILASPRVESPTKYAGDQGTGERLKFWKAYGRGTLDIVAEVLGVPPREPSTTDLDEPDLSARAIAYVEAKNIDWPRVQQFLHRSQRQNQWTNFGPVCLALEEILRQVLELPEDRAVVMTSSATTALVALAGVHAAHAGRPLRWVSSAFAFPAVRTGPLQSALQYVDCDDEGMLDLQVVDALPADSWDGLIVTNVFGLHSELKRYQRFCRQRGKALIIDNAAALLGFQRSWSESPDDIISFHHTKPWGVGEGGCAIVRREDVPLVRSLLAFGKGLPNWLCAFAGNGKTSDFSCSLILERLERLPVWREYYSLQRNRISKAVRQAGLSELERRGSRWNWIPGTIAALAQHEMNDQDLLRSRLPLRRYFAPLAPNMPRATRLYMRMINVPCHPGLAAWDTAAIVAALRRVHGL